MTAIRIESDGFAAGITVDGQDIKGVTAAVVSLSPNGLPEVHLRLSAMHSSIALQDAKLVIQDVEMPEAVERALLEHLCRKYPMTSGFMRATGGLFDVAGSEA